MEGFERSAARIKAVYGRPTGLVARRKALAAKALQINDSSESSDSNSDIDDEKENQRPAETQRFSRKLKVRELSCKASSSSTTCISDSEEEHVVVSARRRARRPGARVNRGRLQSQSEDEEDEHDKGRRSIDDLVVLIDKNLKIAPEQSRESRAKAKVVNPGKSDDALLLEACKQQRPEDFSTFLTRLEYEAECEEWKKIGEASYSEVYGLASSQSVIKVIPLLDPKSKREKAMPEASLIREVHREIQMTRALSRVGDGFVKLQSATVVQGRYPSRLLHARAARPPTDEESNPCPSSFPPNQLYAALQLCDGGQDLESVEDLTWKQAASIFCQVVDALACAEKAHLFEHRDLHWGNIVIAPVEEAHKEDLNFSKGKAFEHFKDAARSGVKATIIDYTLSRATINDSLIAYSFEDESLFEGEGDMQFDIYRRMREETKGDWSGYHPQTNVLWLNYLASKLIDEKGIPNPKRRSQLGTKCNGQELQCRNFLMQAKQLLQLKRFESACDYLSNLSAIPL